MSQAQRLLVDTESNIATISAEVGCSSAQQLTKLFRRVNGIRPQRRRMQCDGRQPVGAAPRLAPIDHQPA